MVVQFETRILHPARKIDATTHPVIERLGDRIRIIQTEHEFLPEIASIAFGQLKDPQPGDMGQVTGRFRLQESPIDTGQTGFHQNRP